MRKSVKRETKELGELRTSQLITSHGIGAIVDFKNETAILGGADDWYQPDRDGEERVLRCHNLEKILEREFFVKPKCDQRQKAVFQKAYSHDIGAYRFPKILYCPDCTFLCSEEELGGNPKGELGCPRCGRRLVPSRFVVVCRHGHIDDFPYYEWVHRGVECEKAVEGEKKQLKLFNINGRTNLGSLMVSCEVCGKIRSMQDAFVPETFSAIYKCRGKQPWLERDAYNQCNEQAVVRMRASTGVYMPVNISALNIPPWSSKVGKLLLAHMDAMEGKSEDALKSYIQKKIHPYLPGIPLQQILGQYQALTSDYNQTHPTSLKELYEEEYRALCQETEDADADFSSRELDVPNKYRGYISKVVAIDRLTEIVSMIGFTRLQGWDGNFDSPSLAPIFTWDQKTWLPAIDMHGEGIFIQMDEQKVVQWERRNRKIYEPMMASVYENHFHCENASARYVLLHTLAHLMIRSLAKLAGYQTSSMKERIYSTYEDGQAMAGILIYTASSDAEGSLGGLVAQAEAEHVEEIIDALLEEAQWCSGDPLCMTSTGSLAQGLFGLNYAACHQCTLLPETSCCNRNLLLDRAALIGREEDGTTGFFIE